MSGRDRTWLTAGEAAERIGVHRNTLAAIIAAGEGPPRYRLHRAWVYDPQDLDRWIESRREKEARAS